MNKTHVTWTEAFDEELELVADRRNSDPSKVKDSLVGLAISGGGIRSATFALGVLEALKKLGRLHQIDYLSTVSGGGYIGSWLSANCKRAADEKKTSWLEPDANWKPSVDHLRRYSNYLSPTLGFFSADTWSMAAIWVRNTLLVQLTVVLAIAVALLVPRPLYQAFGYWPHSGGWRWLTIFLYVVGAVGIAGNHLRVSRRDHAPFLQGRAWPRGLIAAVILLAAAAGLGVYFDFHPFGDSALPLHQVVPIALLLLAGGFCLQPVVVKLVNKLWPGKNAPGQINYTQAWVQALVVLPMMAVGFFVGAIMWHQANSGNLSHINSFSEFFLTAWRSWDFPLSVVFISMWLFAVCSVRDWKDWKCWAIATLAPLPAMVTLHALLCGIMVVLRTWAPMTEQGKWLAYTFTPAMVLYAFSLAAVVLIGMMGRQSSEGVREWWSRFGAWLGIYGFVWLLISISAAFGPLFSALLLLKAGGWTLPIGWVGTTLAGLFAGNSSSTGEPGSRSKLSIALDVVARIAPFVFLAGLLVAISTALHLLIVSDSGQSWKDLGDLVRRHWTLMDSPGLAIQGVVAAICFGALLLLAWRVDINEFSLNAFYRSRLVRCYLGATRFHEGERHPQHFTGFDERDDLPLSSLTTLAGPFHIVNCALNLGGSRDLALHTRHSATFTLTPLRCGTSYKNRDQSNRAAEVGYSLTQTYGGKQGQPTLGQAISVSGAAASPNSGYHTSPIVAFVMTLFNVRLGWWFPNPAMSVHRASPLFSLRYLLSELFGGANDKSAYLAISDGGHFENLAAYELIKRKCKVIIISDGECDPNLRFEGLGTLIRMCQVDFQATIDIDVNSIRPGEHQWSSKRCAVGKIEYSDKSQGTLIYLKASMTGEEETDILQYKAAHSSFPHESTGNQFYTEDQFESYRSLGRDIAHQTFEPAKEEGDLVAAAEVLKDIWSPALHDAAKFTRHSTQLMSLWSKISGNEDLEFLDQELTNAWPDAPTSGFRPAFYLCSEMLQLMENVFIDLRLEETWDHPDNAGWRTTFVRWANSPAIRQTWQLTSETYGVRFQYFCKRRLNLPLAIRSAAAQA